MNGLVVDASITPAWCFEDETTPYTNGVLTALPGLRVFAPVHWALEVGNTLHGAKRKERLTEKQLEEKLEFIRALPIHLEPLVSDVAFGGVMMIAEKHVITTYDASYVELAKRLGTPLATLDGTGKRQGLKQAAERLGVKLFKPPSP